MIDIKQLNFAYQTTAILEDISLSIAEADFLGMIGPNGAGKSTLLKLVNGLLSPQSGDVLIHGIPVTNYPRKELAKSVGFVAQEFTTAFSFTAYEIVLMGRYPYLPPFRQERETDRSMIRKAMEETDVWHLGERQFGELSGGERQLVVLASALAQEPQILLLDEPTTALDLKHQIQFYRILQTLRQEKGITIVTVTHDINLAARFCERIVVMKEGRIVADGTPKKILQKSLMESVYEVEIEIIAHPHDGKPLLLWK